MLDTPPPRPKGTPGDAIRKSVRGKKIGRPTLSDNELLDAALELFLAHGYERTSLDAIANSASMAKRTIYSRFGDKESLFRRALSRAIDEWIVPVDQLRKLETNEIGETLLAIGRALLTNIMSPEGLQLFRLTNTVSERMPEIAARNVKQGTEPTINYIADLLRRQIEFKDTSLLDPETAAFAFIHLVVGGPSSMAAWGVQLDEPEIDRHALSSVALFLSGILPREDDQKRLSEENRRLRNMLTDTLLENATLKESLRKEPE